MTIYQIYQLAGFAITPIEADAIEEKRVQIDGKWHRREAGEVSYHATEVEALRARWHKRKQWADALRERLAAMHVQLNETMDGMVADWIQIGKLEQGESK